MNEPLPIEFIKPVIEQDSFCSVLPCVEKVDGMIFAVAACPEIPMPEQWMPWLIQSGSSRLVDSDVDILADTLMNGLRSHLDYMRQGRIALPPYCVDGVESKGDTKRPSYALSQWLTGLLFVHKNVESVWQNAWQQAEKKESNAETGSGEPPEARLTRCLKMFSTLANIELAYQQRRADQVAQLSENLPLLMQQLPALLKDYTNLAGDLACALPNQFETFSKSTENTSTDNQS
ncbi:UPF0149 family protein [Alteromonas genovensis]|uniref:UPF0149 family protein n=1 Tax=Alteromonas genovensis TaxID=471225 RepID=A0A6N9TGZ6_9ALTE|nr:UPF0149 family protein [Alteromonas genovensis]